MAIYHLSVKAVSRSDGRSATAAAAYRAGCRIVDERSGEIHDYTRKHGVESADIILPNGAPSWALDRSALWNAAERAEKRKDACVAREFEVALPIELPPDERRRLALDFAQRMADLEGCAVDVAIHAPDKDRTINPHAHILRTTRKVGPDGLGDKLDTEKAGRKRTDDLHAMRALWADMTNARLHANGIAERIDHRTLKAMGINRIPQPKLGPTVVEMERRGIRTERGTHALDVANTNAAIAAITSDLEALDNAQRHHEDPAGTRPEPDRGSPGAARRESGDPRPARPREHADARPGQTAAGQGMARQPDAGQQGHGRADRQDAAGHGRADRQDAADRRLDRTSRGGSAGHQPPADALDAHRGHPGGHPRLDALDRIPALVDSLPGGPGPGQRPTLKTDRSYLAARRQIDALGVDEIEIGVRDQDGRMLTRTGSRVQVLASLGWLRAQNVQGADIYVRPAGDQNAGLVLVDDLNRGQIERMKADGFAPATVIETSPDNFQVWVRISADPLPPAVATAAAQSLAKAYGGDPNSADWRHFGRLAGLTNTKPHHRDARNRSPYVLAHESPGNLAPAGPALVARAIEHLMVQQARQKRLEAAWDAPRLPDGLGPVQTYQSLLRGLLVRYGDRLDASKADYQIGVQMACGGFHPDHIAHAIDEASPQLAARKGAHRADYVARTVAAVMRSPEVIAYRQAPRPEVDEDPDDQEPDSFPESGPAAPSR